MAIELAYINTKHPDFHRDAELVSLMMKSAEEDEFSRQRMLRKYNVNNSATGCDRDVSVRTCFLVFCILLWLVEYKIQLLYRMP